MDWNIFWLNFFVLLNLNVVGDILYNLLLVFYLLVGKVVGLGELVCV